MESHVKPTPVVAPATGQGAGSIDKALSIALGRIHSKLRPWHLYTLLAASLLAMVLAIVLVHVREEHRKSALIQVQVNTPSSPSAARVNLGYAQYQGTLLGNGIAQYLGLRFAKSPTEELRWRAPVEAERVEGDQVADTFGKICLGISAALPSDNEGEDCLFANVWAPANATLDSKLPVWLFIQGGGYTANSNANWNGSYVVEASGRNVVFVNFNYRVGLYGFLAGERVRADGDLNVGLLDQRMIMQWVTKYITQFGGDPSHVVINGVSAGAGSVAHHLTAYGGADENLFHGAIAESVFIPAQPQVSELEWQLDRLLSQLGCNDVDDPMSCLRGNNVETLQAANVPYPFPGRLSTPLPLFYWGPCVDGNFIRDYPSIMFENGDFVDVPVLFGTDNNEGSYFGVNASTAEEVAVFFQNNYPHLNDTDTVKILQYYPLLPQVPDHAAWYPSAARAYGEATFICPNIRVLDSIQTKLNSSSSAPAQAWAYRYNVLASENVQLGLGVPHTWETWAVFGPDSINGVGGAPISYYGVDAGIVPIVMHYWISFVRTLDPNVLRYPGAPEWTTWDNEAEQQQLKFETGNVGMEAAASDLRSRCVMWKALGVLMEQ
ncbi:putative Carboxylic ester hydrolase [Seiridium cardinale]|uniref:Carboxylic ester hydrolase n=1 Tax=Seiridium cardinale TaxID=138064 RepID=A0ABR2XJ20_9PEZI